VGDRSLADLGLDQRQRLARWCAIGVEVPVALEALTGESARGLDGAELQSACGSQMNGFDRHASIIGGYRGEPQSAAGARIARDRSRRVAA
jgi:hypothetical protein